MDDLRSGNAVELGAAFLGDDSGDERFAAAGRTVQKHALGRIDAQAGKDLGVSGNSINSRIRPSCGFKPPTSS